MKRREQGAAEPVAGAGANDDARPIDEPLLEAARAGDQRAQNVLLGEVLPLLRAHAVRRLDDRLRARLDPSDLVQVTLMEAASDFENFAGRTRPQLRAWLLQILRTTALDVLKRNNADKRDAARERSLDELLASTMTGRFASPASSPSRKVARRQELLRMSQRLEQLTDAQRQALELRTIEELSVKEIAARMGRSEDSVAALLKRALRLTRDEGKKGDPR